MDTMGLVSTVLKMNTIEVVSAVLLILSCLFIIVIVFFQGGDKGGMSQSITGQSSDNYYQRNMGRSKEMKLKRLTTVAAVIVFVVAIAVNLIIARDWFGDKPEESPAVSDGTDGAALSGEGSDALAQSSDDTPNSEESPEETGEADSTDSGESDEADNGNTGSDDDGVEGPVPDAGNGDSTASEAQ